jgi:D-alanyl-D-alanine dipeptidase
MKKLLLIAATAFFANLIAGEVPIVIATGAGLPLPPIDSLLLNRNGFVDIQQVDSSILVHLVYATSENFLKKNIYGNFTRCYLQKEVAQMLSTAQKLLGKRRHGYHLLVYDGLRPRSYQRIMWNQVKGTPQEGYVANPNQGGLHNYGAAVDLTIVDSSGEELDMGTSFDCFDLKAQTRYETLFIDTALIAGAAIDPTIKNRIRDDIERSGLLSSTSLENRKLLREVMLEAGFIAIPVEWWHFNAFNKEEVRKRFSIVE